MNAPEAVELCTGPGRSLRLAEFVACALASAVNLFAGTTPLWTAVVLCSLGAACVRSVRGGRRAAGHARLLLRPDGSAAMREPRQALCLHRSAGSWCSRLFCVLALQEVITGRCVRVLVCRSLNARGDYRRLLVWLRVARTDPPNDGVGWL